MRPLTLLSAIATPLNKAFSTEPPTQLLDQSCNLLRPGDVDHVACAFDLDFVAFGSCGIPPLKFRVDGSICPRHQHPAWFASPRRCGDDRFEICSRVEHLRSRHKS